MEQNIPHASQMFHLPIEVSVYVPSTKDVDKVISKTEMNHRINEVKEYLATLFGGYSSSPIEGGFLASNNKVVSEDVEKVTSFAQKEDFEKHKEALVVQCSKWADKWGQEAIGLEHEGDLYYVPQKFEHGGDFEPKEAIQMAMIQAEKLEHHIKELKSILRKRPKIEAWVIAKLESASTDLENVTHYLGGLEAIKGQEMAKGGNVSEKMVKVKVDYLEQQYFRLEKQLEMPLKDYKKYEKTGKVERELLNDLISETGEDCWIETNALSVVLTPVDSKIMEQGGEVAPLTIGDMTTIGKIDDETPTQFEINGNWYAKSIVKRGELSSEQKKNIVVSSFKNSKKGKSDGYITLYHGTDDKTFEIINKSGTLGFPNTITFFTSNRAEAKEYARNKSKYRGVEGDGKVIEVKLPSYSVRKNPATGEYESSFTFLNAGDGFYIPTEESLLAHYDNNQFEKGGGVSDNNFIVYHGSPIIKEKRTLMPANSGELGAGLYFTRNFDLAKNYSYPRGEVKNLEEALNKSGIAELDLSHLNIKTISKDDYVNQMHAFYKAEEELNNGDWSLEIAKSAEAKLIKFYEEQGLDGLEVLDEEQGVIFPNSLDKVKFNLLEKAPDSISLNDKNLVFAKGGGVSDQQESKIGKVMREFKEGKLHSSSGDLVTDRKQAIAIALSEAGVPKKEVGGNISETLLAPNGQPTKLTPEQYKLVRTPEFINWFGDWINDPQNASKVVDENGEPLVCYHGTDAEFNTFDKSKIGSNHWQSKSDVYGGGFFFTDKKNKAFSGIKYEVFLNIRKPLINTFSDRYGSEVDYYHATDNFDLNSTTYFQSAKENRNNGIIIKTPRGSLFVAFEPKQIKLADGTNTTFDPKSKDIRFEEGGNLENDVPKVKLATVNKIKKLSKRILEIYNMNLGDEDDIFSYKGDLSFKERRRLFEEMRKLEEELNNICDTLSKEQCFTIDDENFIALNDGGDYGNDEYYRKGGNISETLLAPNGQPTKLSPEQYKLVRTPEFINWFGDWINDPQNASKVVDSNGEPLVCYHGSDFKFNTFDIKKARPDGFHGKGFYFATSDLEYGKNLYACFLNFRKPFDINADYSKDEIKAILKDRYSQIETLIDEEALISYNGLEAGYVFYSFAGNDALREAGFDGLIHSEIRVAFEPNQIKLADGTNTTFDPTNNDIRFKNGGNINDYEYLKKQEISKIVTKDGREFDSKSILDGAYIKSDSIGDNILLAPNGNPSNLTPEQYKLVRTPEFINWFGDWINDPQNASKVVDENGEPMQMYHNTYAKNFTVFDKKKLGDATGWETAYLGFYFANRKSSAYGNRTVECFLNIKNPHIINVEYFVDFDYDYKEKTDELLNSNFFKENQYDGIKIEVEKLDTTLDYDTSNVVVVAFEPNQIKLSDGTNTTFDPTSNDIRFERGGDLGKRTPTPIKERISGSRINDAGSSKDLDSANEIKFDEDTLTAISNKVQEHNKEFPNKKIATASAKAVVRRGMGAYSSSHRPTITDGKPNSRVAWGLARLNAFIYKVQNGKSESGKYIQDDDLIQELGIRFENGGNLESEGWNNDYESDPIYRGLQKGKEYVKLGARAGMAYLTKGKSEMGNMEMPTQLNTQIPMQNK